jgi:hypothetical protein
MRTGSPGVVRVIAVLSAVSVLAGCARVRPVDPAAAGPDLGDINRKVAGRSVLVKLVDGTVLRARDVIVSESSVSFREERFTSAEHEWPAREARRLPISEVASIEVTSRSRGALDGALYGLGAGVLLGALIGAVTFEPTGDLLISSSGDAAILGGLVFGVIGAGFGFLVGSSVGSTAVFDLRDRSNEAGAGSPVE